MIYQIDKEVAEQLKDFFNRFNFIDKVVVFGSRARHDCNPKSDIDLCIYSLEMNNEEFTKLKFELDDLPILYKLDIVHFEKSNKELKSNIIRDEKLLFQKILNFDDFFENLAGKKYQISKKDYLDEGLYPIVDQGQKFIVAYSDNEDKLFSINKPVIIFGDHTRAIKYIDFDFIIGADGTKVLLAKNETIDTKYAYYHLLNTKIENLGYSRHFKILKEKTFILKTLTKQKEIASILDKAQALISLRKESIKKLDELSKSIFIDMFGDPVSNPKKFERKKLENVLIKVTDGTHHSPPMVEKGYKYITAKHIKENKIVFENKETYVSEEEHRKIFKRCSPEKGDVLYIKDGATTGVACINTFEEEFSLLSSVALLKPSKYILSSFVVAYLNNKSVKDNILLYMAGGAIKRLTIKKIKEINIVVPPIELQNKFANIIEKIEEQKSLYEEELEKLEENFKALLQKSFK